MPFKEWEYWASSGFATEKHCIADMCPMLTQSQQLGRMTLVTANTGDNSADKT